MDNITLWPLWLLVVIMPLVFAPSLQNNFRLPKLLVAEVLAALSLVALAFRLRDVSQVDLRAMLRRPVVWACGGVLLVAGLGLLTSTHPVFVRPALRTLALALVALVVWESAVRLTELRKLFIALTFPAGVLAVLAVLQYHGIYQPFPLEVDANSRLALTSLAGSPFDLATFLVIPILIAQGALARRDLGRSRAGWLVLLGVCLYAVALTQTLSALAAIGFGSILLWMQLVDRRRLIILAVTGAVVAAALFAGARPLRQRVIAKVEQVRDGNLNDALTGRLDGWRTAWWMLERRPVVGIGHGAYRAEFAEARLALVARGVRFYRSQQQPFFENPHSDLLAAAVGWGWLGVVALVAGLGFLGRASARAWRTWRAQGTVGTIDAAVASAALGATLLQTTATFPLHLAMVVYPLLVLIAALFRAGRDAVPPASAAIEEAPA